MDDRAYCPCNTRCCGPTHCYRHPEDASSMIFQSLRLNSGFFNSAKIDLYNSVKRRETAPCAIQETCILIRLNSGIINHNSVSICTQIFNYTRIIIKMNREWKKSKAERVFHSNWLLAITRRLAELINLISMFNRQCSISVYER